MANLGLGLIGCGWAARNLHMAGYRDSLDLKACCSRTKSKVRNFQKEFGFEEAYTDYRDLLRHPGIDIVAICTPASERLEIIENVAKAQKDIFVEKPLAWERNEAHKLVEICIRYGVKLAVADQYRFFPHVRKAGDIIKEDLLGKPFTGLLETSVFFNYPPYPGQKRGFVIEQVTHNFDVVRSILSKEAIEVYSKIGKAPWRVGKGEIREFWDTTTVTFDDGCVIQFFNSWDCKGKLSLRDPEGRLHIECDRGTLFLNKDDKTPLIVYSEDLGGWFKPDVKPQISKDKLEAYGTGESMRNFIKCIEKGIDHPLSGEEYLKTLEISFAAYESAEKNKPVSL